jgi:hypothetical protein
MQKILDFLSDEIDKLNDKHKKQIDELNLKIKELENKPTKTIIKYVKR